MAQSKSQSAEPPEQRLRDTLRSDFKQKGFWRRIRQDLSDIREFYIPEEKKSRLEEIAWFRRWFYLIFWMLKSMLLKLTPARRILLIAALVMMVFMGRTEGGNEGDVSVSINWHFLGTITLLFVFMLELKDRVLAHTELDAGRKVQAALLPELSPSVSGWSLWLFTRPANEVGGDLVDLVRKKEGPAGVVLADVSGKGLQAALLMAKLQATIRAFAPDFDSPAKLLTKINGVFHRDSLPSTFASMLYVEIIPNSGSLRFVNAGHLRPLLFREDGWHEMSKGETALGLLEDAGYTENPFQLEPGDVFLAYSDGVSDARNSAGDFFGTERLMKVLPSLRTPPVDQIGGAITAAVASFVGESRSHDDLSLIILKRA